MEMSKRIFWAVSLLVAVVTLFAMAAMWKMRDLSALPVLIGAVFAEYAVGTGFYYSKARAENLEKIKKNGGAENEYSED